MTTQTPPSKNDTILIVGAGEFGLSTALELKKRGYKHVTVIDRYLPPVPDGSSVDISRVIRVEYADPLYAKMAREAREGWQTEYKNHYYQSGFVQLADQAGHPYIEKSKELSKELGERLDEFLDARQITTRFPSIQANLKGLRAYANPGGGWANAEESVRQLSTACSQAGVTFITGPAGRAISLKKNENGRVIGVNVAQGPPILASLVILATGAWTNRLISAEHALSASGQPVGFIQLSQEEADKIKDMPVMINLSTGVFVFPPMPGTNILKVARHSFGFSTKVPVEGTTRFVSSPRRDANGVDGAYIPSDAEEGLREGLRQLVPEFANHPWLTRRLCWYTDTPEGDFVIDYHPQTRGLFFATGGAGHGFKFLPVIGRYIVDCFENKASADIRQKWRFREPTGKLEPFKFGDGSRGGPPIRTLNAVEQAKL